MDENLWKVIMSDKKLIVDGDSLSEKEVVEKNRLKHAYLAIVVFLVTVLFSQYGSSIIDNLVMKGLGDGFRWIVILAGFYFYFPIQKIINEDHSLRLNEAIAIMKDEFSQIFNRDKRQAMTAEEKKDSRKIFFDFIRFSIGVIAVGFMLDVMVGLVMIRFMN